MPPADARLEERLVRFVATNGSVLGLEIHKKLLYDTKANAVHATGNWIASEGKRCTTLVSVSYFPMTSPGASLIS